MALISRISLHLLVFIFFAQTSSLLQSQDLVIAGTITDTSGTAISDVSVFSKSLNKGTTSTKDGHFILALGPADILYPVIFSCVGFKSDTVFISAENAAKDLKITLVNEVIQVDDVSVTAARGDRVNSILIPVAASAVMPSVSSGIEAVVSSMPGVSSFSELSYQYSVRGGSYDENLIYINDIEIYRPYLIRSGQQEGLSQINPDLVSSVEFFPGGFSAAYGDRMSSVLDIKYRKPLANEGSVSLSLLTSSAHAGLISRSKKFYLLAGIRHRSNALLLKSLDATGQYKPSFTDVQVIAGYKTGLHSHLTISLWGSSNRYSFIPESQTTRFGSVTAAYKLFAYFEGGERDKYDNLTSALMYEVRHNEKFITRFILSGHLASENENFDIRGAYSLSALDKTEGSENNPDSLLNIGIGSWLNHARNRLQTDIVAISYKGYGNAGNNTTVWGITGRYRNYKTRINEWLRVDSAGYTAGNNDDHLVLTSYTSSESSLSSFGAEAYVDNTTHFTFAEKRWDFNAGIRASVDTYNHKIFFSPRVSLKVRMSSALSSHLSLGAYHQPPGGRELMRQIENATYPLEIQHSYHITAGTTYDFYAWGRPFRFAAEVYGKIMDQMIPYSVENVRLVYYGGNTAEGFTTGLDMRVNGEFVPGTESWFSLSFMKSSMRIPTSQTRWFPSPFDQRLNLDIFFQDYLPGHPDFRAHVNIVFGTGIPSSPPGSYPWDIWFRLPPYRRIDIGFSKVLIGNVRGRLIGNPHSAFKELTAGLEIFNLADIRNTISYTWIRSVMNSDGISIEYAVPNYLTSRSLNLKLSARF